MVTEVAGIGGSVGHVAVGAAYIAGSAGMSAAVARATAAQVGEAAGKVSDEMKTLDEAWQGKPAKKPSEKALSSAVADLKTAGATR